MEKKLVKIGEAAKILGTRVNTLRRWEASDEFSPNAKTALPN
jgi:putative resolvase